ncbi:hypothetical protein GE118_03340 [Mycoplasma sp. NEAQ87857]|uniref:hypothetical protein n=1 Tax=Mycoplasma sp. NEAQ87857 TaxID=2683967 RepID=UPI001318FA2C|nr:hypothetical protein [Mycoplasma sp. NEAQ87857]QGZ97823.1 hypothetical protein GE118_03340 [Mycoplasma sp. NEAQ87857]
MKKNLKKKMFILSGILLTTATPLSMVACSVDKKMQELQTNIQRESMKTALESDLNIIQKAIDFYKSNNINDQLPNYEKLYNQVKTYLLQPVEKLNFSQMRQYSDVLNNYIEAYHSLKEDVSVKKHKSAISQEIADLNAKVSSLAPGKYNDLILLINNAISEASNIISKPLIANYELSYASDLLNSYITNFNHLKDLATKLSAAKLALSALIFEYKTFNQSLSRIPEYQTILDTVANQMSALEALISSNDTNNINEQVKLAKEKLKELKASKQNLDLKNQLRDEISYFNQLDQKVTTAKRYKAIASNLELFKQQNNLNDLSNDKDAQVALISKLKDIINTSYESVNETDRMIQLRVNTLLSLENKLNNLNTSINNDNKYQDITTKISDLKDKINELMNSDFDLNDLMNFTTSAEQTYNQIETDKKEIEKNDKTTTKVDKTTEEKENKVDKEDKEKESTSTTDPNPKETTTGDKEVGSTDKETDSKPKEPETIDKTPEPADKENPSNPKETESNDKTSTDKETDGNTSGNSNTTEGSGDKVPGDGTSVDNKPDTPIKTEKDKTEGNNTDDKKDETTSGTSDKTPEVETKYPEKEKIDQLKSSNSELLTNLTSSTNELTDAKYSKLKEKLEAAITDLTNSNNSEQATEEDLNQVKAKAQSYIDNISKYKEVFDYYDQESQALTTVKNSFLPNSDFMTLEQTLTSLEQKVTNAISSFTLETLEVNAELKSELQTGIENLKTEVNKLKTTRTSLITVNENYNNNLTNIKNAFNTSEWFKYNLKHLYENSSDEYLQNLSTEPANTVSNTDIELSNDAKNKIYQVYQKFDEFNKLYKAFGLTGELSTKQNFDELNQKISDYINQEKQQYHLYDGTLTTGENKSDLYTKGWLVWKTNNDNPTNFIQPDQAYANLEKVGTMTDEDLNRLRSTLSPIISLTSGMAAIFGASQSNDSISKDDLNYNEYVRNDQNNTYAFRNSNYPTDNNNGDWQHFNLRALEAYLLFGKDKSHLTENGDNIAHLNGWFNDYIKKMDDWTSIYNEAVERTKAFVKPLIKEGHTVSDETIEKAVKGMLDQYVNLAKIVKFYDSYQPTDLQPESKIKDTNVTFAEFDETYKALPSQFNN